jgi:hypothetical protein
LRNFSNIAAENDDFGAKVSKKSPNQHFDLSGDRIFLQGLKPGFDIPTFPVYDYFFMTNNFEGSKKTGLNPLKCRLVAG